MKVYLFCYIGALFIIGCKGETPIDELPLVTPTLPQNKVEVVVDMIVDENDVFELFYTEDGTGNFGPKSVRVNVPGMPKSQKIVFMLPDNAVPANIRLDVGQNPGQDEMIFKGMIVKCHDKSLHVNAVDFFKYFSPNGDIEVNAEEAEIIPAPRKDDYDPALFPQPAFTDILVKLLLPQQNLKQQHNK